MNRFNTLGRIAILVTVLAAQTAEASWVSVGYLRVLQRTETGAQILNRLRNTLGISAQSGDDLAEIALTIERSPSLRDLRTEMGTHALDAYENLVVGTRRIAFRERLTRGMAPRPQLREIPPGEVGRTVARFYDDIAGEAFLEDLFVLLHWFDSADEVLGLGRVFHYTPSPRESGQFLIRTPGGGQVIPIR